MLIYTGVGRCRRTPILTIQQEQRTRIQWFQSTVKRKVLVSLLFFIKSRTILLTHSVTYYCYLKTEIIRYVKRAETEIIRCGSVVLSSATRELITSLVRVGWRRERDTLQVMFLLDCLQAVTRHNLLKIRGRRSRQLNYTALPLTKIS